MFISFLLNIHLVTLGWHKKAAAAPTEKKLQKLGALQQQTCKSFAGGHK